MNCTEAGLALRFKRLATFLASCRLRRTQATRAHISCRRRKMTDHESGRGRCFDDLLTQFAVDLDQLPNVAISSTWT